MRVTLLTVVVVGQQVTVCMFCDIICVDVSLNRREILVTRSRDNPGRRNRREGLETSNFPLSFRVEKELITFAYF